MLRLQVGDQVGRGDAADLALAVRLRVQQRIVGRLVAGDVQPDQLAPRAALPFGEQSAAAR